MQIIPALTLRDGACVDDGAAAAGLLEADPALRARQLEAAGAPALHLVELGSQERGRLERLLDILDVLMAVAIPVQVRAGLCRDEEIGQILSRGAARAVVETTRMDPPRRAACAARFGERVVAALELDPGIPAADLRREALGLRSAGFARLLCRALSTAPADLGPLPPLAAGMAAAGLPLIWEGGVESLERIRALAALPAVEGVILHPRPMGRGPSLAEACAAAAGG